MVSENDRLEVEMGVTLKRLTQELARAEKRMVTTANKMERGFDKSSRRSAASFKNIDRAAARTFSRISQLAVTGLSVREVQRYADAWTVAGNKIASASQISGKQARSLSELNEIAADTRSGITETADLYAKLLRATKDVAESEIEVARATEIVNKAFKAGGAAASEQAAGILQLAQGLSSGILQGDELRSLRENAPLIAQAIANEFETTIGGLKDLGAQGELTAARVFTAILKSQGDIEAVFATTNSTIGEGFTVLRNALTEYVGAADKSLGATAKIVTALEFLAENLDKVAIAGGLVLTRFGGAALGSIFASLAVQARLAATAIAATGAATAGLNASLALLGGPVGAVLTGLVALAFVVNKLPDSQAELQKSIDNVTLAMGDEITQLNQLLALQPGANTMTLAAAQAKLQEAEAIYTKLEAQREELETTIRTSEAYQAVLQTIEGYREALRSIAPAGTDLEDIPVRLRAAYSEAEEGLVAALAHQRELLDIGGATTAEMAKAKVEIDRWRDAIEKSKGQFVSLNGEIITGVELSERLKVLADSVNFDKAVSSAQQLAKQLGVSVALAKQIANIRSGGGAEEKNNNGLDALDPRNPNNTRPIFDGPTGTVSPFDPSRQKTTSSGGGGGGGSSGGTAQEGLFADIGRQAEELKFQISLIGKTEREVAKLEAASKLLTEAKKRGLDLDARQTKTGLTLREEIEAQAEAVADLKEQYENGSISQQKFEETIDSLSEGLAQAAIGATNLRDVFKNVLAQIAQDIISSNIKGLLQGLFKPSNSSGGGLLGGVLGKVFGGFRASGGPVSSGKGYVVGENGPEFFSPKTNGTIIPNGATAASQSVAIRLMVPEGVTAEMVGQISQGIAVSVVTENNRQIGKTQRRA